MSNFVNADAIQVQENNYLKIIRDHLPAAAKNNSVAIEGERKKNIFNLQIIKNEENNHKHKLLAE